MQVIPGQCLARSVGAGNELMTILIQTLLHAYCTLSDPSIWPEDFGPIVLKTAGILEYDFVIVGAGTAGSVIGSRLTESSMCDVLLLEAGGEPPVEVEIPKNLLYIFNTEFDWKYKTNSNNKSCLGTRNRDSCSFPCGKMMGGSGGMSAMIYSKGNPKNYDDWSQAGNEGWSWKDVQPLFERSIKKGEPDQCTPNQGYLPLNPPIWNDPLNEVLKSALIEIGVPIFNDGDDNYVGYVERYLTHENGRRVNVGKGFLGAAKERSNFHLIHHALATKINFNQNKRATSVSFLYKGKMLEVFARKEIIISAGIIGTPKLLMLSGIGPSNNLDSLKIDVIKNCPVGRTFLDHPGVSLYFLLKPTEENIDIDDSYNYLIHGKGPLTTNLLNLVGYLNLADPKSPYPDVSVYHMIMPRGSPCAQLIVNLFGFHKSLAKGLLEASKEYDILMTSSLLLNPKSTGNITLFSSCYADNPIINLNFLDNDDDLNLLVTALEYQLKLLNTRAFKKLNAKILNFPLAACSKYEFLSKNYLQCYCRYLSSTFFQSSGTVKMGPKKDKNAVVDNTLKVKDIDGLRVADGSIVPFQISDCLGATVLMIAEKAAELIQNDYKCGEQADGSCC